VFIRNYFKRCRNDGIIKGPFLSGYDINYDQEEIRFIDINLNKISETGSRILKIYHGEHLMDYIAPAKIIKQNILRSHKKFLKSNSETHIRNFVENIHGQIATKKEKKTYAVISFITTVYDTCALFKKLEIWYCEIIPQQHGILIKIPQIFGKESFIFISNNGMYSNGTQSKKSGTEEIIVTYEPVNTNALKCIKDKIIGYRITPVIFFLAIRKYSPKFPKPLIGIIVNMVYKTV